MRSATTCVVAACLMAVAPGCRNPDLFDFDGDGAVDADDCAPEDERIYPGAEEICDDGLDNDCDGYVDGDDSHCQEGTEDQDGDGWTNTEGDCDDTDPDVHPGQSEIECNGVDDDCDVGTADGPDEDGDTYTTCPEPAEDHDCDDTTAEVHPGHEEICGDGLDNDCDGTMNDCGWYGVHSLSDADARLLGTEPYGYAGTGIGGGCDLDDDGIPDLIAGAPNHVSGGMAYVVSSAVTGDMNLNNADARIQSESSSEDFGAAMDCAVDLDDDGFDDLGGGAPNYTAGGDVDVHRGAVYVIPGPLSGYVDAYSVAYRISGEAGGDWAGGAVADTGDVTGDGIADLLVGAPFGNEDAGAVYVVEGPITGDLSLGDAVGRVSNNSSGGYLGHRTIDAGDVDLDGNHDVLIGAYGQGSGTAYLVRGPITGNVTAELEADLRLVDGTGNAGKALGAGDTDGDGDIELLLGFAEDPYAPTQGGAYLADGTALGEYDMPDVALARLEVPSPGEQAGSAVVMLDFNGDGADDVVVSERRDSVAWEEAGAVHLVYGPVSGDIDLANADLTLLGDAAGGYAGNALTNLGDVDGDGTEDLLIGAYCHDPGTEDPAYSGDYGAAFVVLGRPGW